jgi:Uma2 family endonuclease
MSVQERIGMPMEEFIRLYNEAPFELVNGERILLVPTVAIHSEVIRLLHELLIAYRFIHKNVIIYIETAFAKTDSPDWVKGSRVPDIMIYSTARFEAYKAETPDWKDKPYLLIPDLCIEVISQNDNYTDVEDKVAEYLRDGVRLVWVINPRAKSVAVYTAGSEQITRLTEGYTLTGGDVLPDFSIPVSDIFPS